MAKQLHLRLDDSVYNALIEYNDMTGASVQDSISSAVMQYACHQYQQRDQ